MARLLMNIMNIMNITRYVVSGAIGLITVDSWLNVIRAIFYE